MSYQVLLGSRAAKQLRRLDKRAQERLKEALEQLKEEPQKRSFILSGDLPHLRYIKVSHGGIQYGVVFKLDSQRGEIGVLFLGTRQNFYRELKRYLR
ncbi:MAG: type II toxin-antitoxin system RelE/ParE family toxin [Candidatus Bipolaricaulia bacterium]